MMRRLDAVTTIKTFLVGRPGFLRLLRDDFER